MLLKSLLTEAVYLIIQHRDCGPDVREARPLSRAPAGELVVYGFRALPQQLLQWELVQVTHGLTASLQTPTSCSGRVRHTPPPCPSESLGTKAPASLWHVDEWSSRCFSPLSVRTFRQLASQNVHLYTSLSALKPNKCHLLSGSLTMPFRHSPFPTSTVGVHRGSCLLLFITYRGGNTTQHIM